jgi:Cu(I)/Ag(I) efflux system membrane fusion protein
MEKKNIAIILVTLFVGLGMGYLIFGGSAPVDEHNHSKGEQAEGVIWTCAMHPQIRQDEFGTCPLCEMDLTPLEQNGSGDPLVFTMSDDAVKLSNIQTTVIGGEASDFDGKLKVTGKIQANETTAASLVAHIPGRIKKLYISFTGEKVSVGQKIAQIYSPDLIAAQKELLEAKKISGTNPSLLAAAKNKLKYWKITDAQIEKILTSEEVQEHFMIYADYSGIVKKRKVSVGDYLSKGEVLFDIQDLNKLWVLFDVYESDLSKIKVGSEVAFKTPSLQNEEFVAKISFVDPIINASTRAATVRAELNNSSKKLKPEMFVNGSIASSMGSNEDVIVPKTAIMWTGERSVVYVKVPGADLPSFEYREITLGESIGKNYLVTEGISNGEEVVTNGAFVIDASAQLNNQASMMNKHIAGPVKEKPMESPDYISSTPDAFKKQLQAAIESYLLLKDNLVVSDPAKAKKSATAFKTKLKSIDMALLKGDAHMYWMDQLMALNSHTDLIISKDGLEDKRKQFDFLSQAVIKSIKAFGVNDVTYYEQYCSMANEDQGASWISLNDEIMNPYYGDAMLHCGEVSETITVK